MIESVKIGGVVYEVAEVDDLRDESDTKLDGQFKESESLISLRSGLSEQYQYSVLWHEIVHGILIHAGVNGEHDEQLINCIAYGLVQVLKDNPELVESQESDDPPANSFAMWPGSPTIISGGGTVSTGSTLNGTLRSDS